MRLLIKSVFGSRLFFNKMIVGIHLLLIMLVIATLAFTFGCAKEPKEINIGVVLPLTGDGAGYGEKEKNGIELAITEINNSGGIDGKLLKSIYEDSQGVPTPATQATQKLINQDKVQVIVGAAFSSPTLAMVPIIDRNKVILMSPTASSPDLSGSSKYFFRVWPSDVAEGSIIAEVGIKNMNLKKFAILHANNDYAIGLKNVFIETINKFDRKVATVEVYNDGDTDFRSQLTKIKYLSPDAIYMAGYFKEFANILIQAKEIGINAQFLSCGTFPEPEILKIAGEASEGVVFAQPYFDRNSKDELIKKFVADYEMKFGIEAGIYAAHGYDAMIVIAQAMKIGGTQSEEIINALLSLKEFPGVAGKITFTSAGDIIKPARIMTVINGQFIEY